MRENDDTFIKKGVIGPLMERLWAQIPKILNRFPGEQFLLIFRFFRKTPQKGEDKKSFGLHASILFEKFYLWLSGKGIKMGQVGSGRSSKLCNYEDNNAFLQ